MGSLGISQQTLQEFIDKPFGLPNKIKHLKYEDRYQSYKKNNKIKVEATLIYEDNYFIHLKIPSESQKGDLYYDVVIQFFTSNEKVKKELSVEHYYVQFFSNSPGFVYKYASLYKLQGYLIESLYDKFNKDMLDVLPDNANSSYEMYFDSSIYYACRYLIDHRLTILGKLNLRINKPKSLNGFFSGIKDIEEVNITRNINSLQSRLKKEINKDTKLSEQQEAKLKHNSNFFAKEILHKKEVTRAKKSTLKNPKNSGIRVKSSTSSTTGNSSVKRVSKTPKKSASKTTRKR